MTPDTLREINSLYARYVRLTDRKRSSAADRSAAYLIRQQLADLGLEIDVPKPSAA